MVEVFEGKQLEIEWRKMKGDFRMEEEASDVYRERRADDETGESKSEREMKVKVKVNEITFFVRKKCNKELIWAPM